MYGIVTDIFWMHNYSLYVIRYSFEFAQNIRFKVWIVEDVAGCGGFFLDCFFVRFRFSQCITKRNTSRGRPPDTITDGFAAAHERKTFPRPDNALSSLPAGTCGGRHNDG